MYDYIIFISIIAIGFEYINTVAFMGQHISAHSTLKSDNKIIKCKCVYESKIKILKSKNTVYKYIMRVMRVKKHKMSKKYFL